jgi:hypothetical protein
MTSRRFARASTITNEACVPFFFHLCWPDGTGRTMTGNKMLVSCYRHFFNSHRLDLLPLKKRVNRQTAGDRLRELNKAKEIYRG